MNSLEGNQIKPISLTIAIDGYPESGKTSLMKRFLDNEFSQLPVIKFGISLRKKTILKLNQQIDLQIWDLAEHGCRFRSTSPIFIKQSNALIFLYDISNRISFQETIKKIQYVYKFHQPKQTIFALIGSKSDLENERQVSYNEGQQLAYSYGIMFLETSSMTGQNVDLLFNNIIEQTIQNL